MFANVDKKLWIANVIIVGFIYMFLADYHAGTFNNQFLDSPHKTGGNSIKPLWLLFLAGGASTVFLYPFIYHILNITLEYGLLRNIIVGTFLSFGWALFHRVLSNIFEAIISLLWVDEGAAFLVSLISSFFDLLRFYIDPVFVAENIGFGFFVIVCNAFIISYLCRNSSESQT